MVRRALVRLAPLLALLLAFPASVSADCPPSCPLPGGGNDAAADCLLEMASTHLRLNYPPHDPAKPKPAKEVRCFDGDPGCDLDGIANNECVFDIDVCLRNADPALPSCTPADVTDVSVSGASSSAELTSLQSAIDALLPATANVCTTGQQLTVPLKGPYDNGEYKRGKDGVKIKSAAGASVDSDSIKLSCIPRNWPAHGYDAQNRRSTPVATAIDVTNVDDLVLQWHYSVQEPLAGGGAARGVTSTPTVDDKNVYITSWNGIVYAIKRKTGTLKWSYDTQSADILGTQSSATLTADGRLLVGDSMGTVHCLNAKNGKLLWTSSLGNPVTESAHLWASATILDDKVIMGKSSHSDQPCTRGELVALSLDTGSELWRTATVPEKICHYDTTVTCNDDADCGNVGSPCVINVCDNDINKPCSVPADCPGALGGFGSCITTQSCFYAEGQSCSGDVDCPSCLPGLGGGVTATAAVDESGDAVYMAAVGCFTSPSIGNSDSIFSLDPDNGDINWVHRTQSIEQFTDGPPYHDYGFLNGPVLVEAGSQRLAVAGSKDGTIYALDRDTGDEVWTNVVAPAPEFAGFGLFNAPIAFADGKFYAGLYQISTWPTGNDHLFAFDATDGSVVWSTQIGASWSAATEANGVLYVGTQADEEYYAFDATTGALLRTFVVPSNGTLPDTSSGGVAVVGRTVYIPYGVFGNRGGVLAFSVPE